MLDGLRKKWNVSPGRMFLILLTFAFGGSLAGYLAKKVMGMMDLESGILWTILYIIVVTLIWPVSVLAISIITGQFLFFKGYLKRMAVRMKLMKNENGN